MVLLTGSNLEQFLKHLLTVLLSGLSGLAGCFPRTVVRLFDLFNNSLANGITKKDMDEMRQLQFRICEGEKLVAQWGVIGRRTA
jgi:2-keto-3-deoxy-L-rhamnonate aldolase